MAAEYEHKATIHLGNQKGPHDGLLWYLQAWLFYKAILQIAIQHVILWPFLNMTATDTYYFGNQNSLLHSISDINCLKNILWCLLISCHISQRWLSRLLLKRK